MSQADIDDLRARYAGISGGDYGAAFRDVHPDFTFRSIDRAPSAGTYVGGEAATRFLEDLWEPFEQVTLEPQEFLENGDRIVAILRVRFRPAGSDAVVENHVGAFWTFRDGKPHRLEMYAQPEQALEAAGLTSREE